MKRVYDNDIRDDEQLLSQVAIYVENKSYDDAITYSTNCFNNYNNYSYPGLLLV
jgi:hypothetical protein